MNSRERVRTALAHREPDRVPIDLGSSAVTGINAVAYHWLKQHLGLNGQPVRLAEIILQLAEVEEPIRQRFGVDVVATAPADHSYRPQHRPQTLDAP